MIKMTTEILGFTKISSQNSVIYNFLRNSKDDLKATTKDLQFYINNTQKMKVATRSITNIETSC